MGFFTLDKRLALTLSLLLCVLCQACAVQPSALPLDCATAQAVEWQVVAPGIWAWLPDHPGELTPANQGHVVPITVVVDAGEALVIDPGPNHQHGLRVRTSLQCQFDAQVRWIVNTHAHAENVLGNSAFADLQTNGKLDILATAGTLEAMQRRCEQCLSHLTETLGPQAMAGTHVVLPNLLLAEGDELVVGRIRLLVLESSHAHTESDLSLWEPQRRVLWAGGLVYEGRIPELAQGRVTRWLQALQRLTALNPHTVVSAVMSTAPDATHPPQALEATRNYLQTLRTQLIQAMDNGWHASESQRIQSLEHTHWIGYKERHGFNVQRAWRELEPEWLDATPLVNYSVPDIRR